ncbi:hypothetical protein [Ohtaekwangia koreensis]|uniref:Chemotaxis phosphatase CheX n=1 Tax=Ohtaekwangia koreensis TaxID=688867 RepID=A0A1T5JS86_9BACT|nr:hypothetical protein [Ohtaekwangia koreensis]SKC54327.1 hypothetical protein SAMN05660236_1436 [Ohtaekwangia koreensis]
MTISDHVKKKTSGSAKIAFENGFENAAASFSKFISTETSYTMLHQGLHAVEDDSIHGLNINGKSGTNFLLTTDIVGDVYGKSYLLLDASEFDALSSGVYAKEETMMDIKEEFIKELDNILSASVITKLSNELNLNIYGNIPILVKPQSCCLMNIIYDDFSEDSEGIYVNAIHFSFEKYPMLTPYFVWVMDLNVFDTIESKSELS